MYNLYGDRDETQGILICQKHTLGAALYAAGELAEHWDRMTVYYQEEGSEEKRVAVVSLKGA